MRISAMLEELQGVMQRHGDLNLFIGDMRTPSLDLSETEHEADFDTYGRKYLFIEEDRPQGPRGGETCQQRSGC